MKRGSNIHVPVMNATIAMLLSAFCGKNNWDLKLSTCIQLD